ncbi:MAG: response regulator transcription factor [Dehalococcoidia bacterium]|nr:MAG: response regulator transcription factor [Dehalococcoidia bacterium]
MIFILVEDDTEIIEFISLALDLGWPDAEITAVNRGKEAIDLISNKPPDVVLLDLGLPDISGFEVLKEIRLFSNIPVIIITVADSEESIVKGLNLGADEYIVKPFGQLELLARIKAVLRIKTNQYLAPVALGPLKYYPESCKLKCGSKDIHLTRTESLIMHELLANKGKVVTYAQLADIIWGDYYPNAPEAIRVYIRRLRSKIETEPGCSGLITSKSGLGYILELPLSV